MLILSRRETERVRLGDSIVVTIVRVSGDKVRLGIEAPPDVLVLRDELQPTGQASGVWPDPLVAARLPSSASIPSSPVLAPTEY